MYPLPSSKIRERDFVWEGMGGCTQANESVARYHFGFIKSCDWCKPCRGSPQKSNGTESPCQVAICYSLLQGDRVKQRNADITNLNITRSSIKNDIIFPVTVKYVEINLSITNRFCQSFRPWLHRGSTVIHVYRPPSNPRWFFLITSIEDITT